MRIHESAEDYLEMILMVKEQKGAVRSIDIANGLNVSKPSVSVAMKHLREDGYILMDKDNYITLTDKGMEIAGKIYNRHKVITRFLMQLAWTRRPPARTPARSSTTSPPPPSRRFASSSNEPLQKDGRTSVSGNPAIFVFPLFLSGAAQRQPFQKIRAHVQRGLVKIEIIRLQHRARPRADEEIQPRQVALVP